MEGEGDTGGILVCTDGYNAEKAESNGGVVSPYCIGLTHAGRADVILLLSTVHGDVWWVDCSGKVRHPEIVRARTTQKERGDANVDVVVEDDQILDEISNTQFSDEEDIESCASDRELPPTSDDGEQEGSNDEASDDVEGHEEEGREDDDDKGDDDEPKWLTDCWHLARVFASSLRRR